MNDTVSPSMSRSLPVLTLSAESRKRRARLHPWVFSNEIQKAPPLAPGSLVLLKFPAGSDCWTAYYNPHSLIAARILGDGECRIDAAWMSRKIAHAIAYRKTLALPREAIRLVHGEADGLPGLVIDSYGPHLVLQSLTAGMDALLPLVVEALCEQISPKGILARCDSEMRSLEGLDSDTRMLQGGLEKSIEVMCHGLRFELNLLESQKTGLYLDQMENHAVLARFASGADALDVCCYTGSCSFFMKKGGAGTVLGIDCSAAAIEQARRNAELNGMSEVTFEIADAFDRLKSLVQSGRQFDMINLDPPPFAKRRKDLDNALRGYRELNRRAFRLLKPGGILATSTCSHHIAPEIFLEMLTLAARDSMRQARVIEVRQQASDHPWLLAAPETRYLCCAILQVG